MSEWVEEFEGFRIEINRISDERFKKNDFDRGFGLTFQVFPSQSNALSFSVVLKSLDGKREESNVQEASVIGKGIVQKRISENNFETNANYCYRWEPNIMSVKEVNCRSINSPVDS